jgi:hypothetical protein
MALALSLGTAPHPAVRPLRRALAMGALATVYLFQFRQHAGSDAPVRIAFDAVAFGLYGAAAIDLAGFLAGYPRWPDREVLLRYFGAQRDFRVAARFRHRLDAALHRIDRVSTPAGDSAPGTHGGAARLAHANERAVRLLVHPLFRWCWIAASAACGAWRSLAPGSQAAATTSMFMMLAMVVPPTMTFEWLRAKYRSADAADRRRIGWIYLGPMLGAIGTGLWFASGPVLLVFAHGTATDTLPLFGIDLRQAWLMGAYCLLPALIASFLLGLAFSVFYRGALDPRLIVHRSLLAGACGLALTVFFVAAENLVSSQIAARFGMPDQTGAIVAGTLAALGFAPLRSRIERYSRTWMEGLMPDPDAPPPPATGHAVACISSETTSRP